MLSSSKVRL